MKLNLAQTKLVGLTMKLDLKAREYKKLCNKLEKYKEAKIDENDERLYELLQEFEKNHEEIVEIKKKLNEIENIKLLEDNNNSKRYTYEDIFKQKEDSKINESNYGSENMMVKYQESFWEKIKKQIRKIFKF